MNLWRVSNHQDLTGRGGIRSSGRWHTKGVPIVYLAEHPALALLETLVHLDLDINEIPKTFVLLEVEYDQEDVISVLEESALQDGWSESEEQTREIGDEWLTSGEYPLLKVPSILAPRSFNYLLNPRHQGAGAATIVDTIHHPYDPRLFKR